jgi:hypothetical protein
VLDVVGQGGGRPLDPEVRSDMESRLGHDFGDVRVHAEVGARTIEELEAERDEVLLGLLELRNKRPETVVPREAAAE